MRRLFNLISFFGLVVTFVFLLSLFYYFFFPKVIIKYQTNPIPLNKTVYKPGNILSITVHYCKYQDIEGIHTIGLVSTQNIVLPTYSSTMYLPVGCGELTYRPVLLESTPPGTYRFVDHVIYQEPFLIFTGKTTSYTIETIPFIVK